MPITGPIPLPGSFGEAAFGPSVSPHTMINDILQRQLNQRKLQQAALEAAQLNKHRAAELAETTRAHNLTHQHNMGSLAETKRSHDLTHEYNMRHLAIQRQAEERAQAQLPYVIQNYKDIHDRDLSDNQIKHLKAKMAQREYDSIIQSIMVTPGQPGQPMEQGVPGQPMQPSLSPQQQQQQQRSLAQEQEQGEGQGQGQGQSPQYGGRSSNLANMMRPLFEAGYRTDQNFTPIGAETTLSPQDQLNMQQNVTQQQPTPTPIEPSMQQGVEQPIQVPQIGQTGQNTSGNNEEIVLKQGNPALALQDKLVGTSFGKPAKTHYSNGYIYTEYPSGKITATKSPISEKSKNTGETSEQLDEKMKRSIQTANEKAEYKENLKEASAVKKDIESIQDVGHDLIKMKEIFSRRKNLTGPGTYYSKKFGAANDPDLGRLIKLTGAYQGKVSALNTARPGIGSLKWAESVKPDIYHQQTLNERMINQGLEDYRDFLINKNNKYKRLKGEDHPEFNNLINEIEDAILPPKEDIEYTAKQRNMTVDQVIKEYKARRFKKNG